MIRTYLTIAGVLVWLGTNVIAYYQGKATVHTEWALERAQSDLEAKTAQAAKESQDRAKEALQAQQTRDMEAEYAKRIKDADAGRDAFAGRLRDAQARIARCQLPPAPVDPGGPQDIAPGSNSGHGPTDFGRAQRLRTVTKKMQALIGTCYVWMQANGR